jgi:hypothetical protein
MLDMDAMVSVLVEAPTVMVLGALAGDMVQLSAPLLLPAAGVTNMTVNLGFQAPLSQ